MVKFKLHGFHILDRLNSYLKSNHGIFELLVIGKIYQKEVHQEIELQAIIYDNKRKEFQVFNKRWHIIYEKHPLNQLFEIFLDDMYLNMVFSIETDGKIVDPVHGVRLYTFRDIITEAFKTGRLPHPTDDFENVRDFQDAFDDTLREHPSQLQQQKRLSS